LSEGPREDTCGRIETHLCLCSKKSANIFPGFFVEQTVFTDVDVGSEIDTQEIFGPIAVVRSFKTEEEVMAMSKDTNFGLMAGVFTQDITKALRVASAFESGMFGVSYMSLMFFTTPFRGSKESGVGRECGTSAMRAFTSRRPS